jgi:hypothetical protein
MKLKLPTAEILDGDRYLRSFLLMRMAIGFLGIGLPVLLIAGDGLFLSGEMPRSSLSAYYHTGMRDEFVGTLCATAFFLITYMFFHYTWDNVLSILAGVAVLCVAVFPTAGSAPLTPLQERLGEAQASRIHFTAAAVFILSLAAISFLFGRSEATAWRRQAHLGCGAAIVAAVAFMLVSNRLGFLDRHSVFYGETVATLAFGLSWLLKGFALDVLLANRRPAAAEPVEPVRTLQDVSWT